MKKANIVKENKDFNRIINKEKAYKSNSYILYKERVDNNNYKFGISVGKKIGNAVTRNKLKRQIRSIISENNYQNNFNCIIILRKAILDKSFLEMKKELLEVFKKLKMLKEK